MAVDLLVGEDHLVDAVIVPLVVGRHLIDPLDRAGVDVARPDGHRPLVVAGPLFRIPGRGISRAIIHQIEIGIVGIPTPGRAAADLPFIALPRAGAGVLADRLAEAGRLFRIDQRVGIGAFRIAAPRQLAGLDIVGADPTANAELAARHADEHLVLEDERSVGAGLRPSRDRRPSPTRRPRRSSRRARRAWCPPDAGRSCRRRRRGRD